MDATMSDQKIAPLTAPQKLDAVMEQLDIALSADRETQFLSVEQDAPGRWHVASADGEVLDFDANIGGKGGRVAMEMFDNGEAVADTKQTLDIENFTLQAAIEHTVDNIGHGIADDVMASYKLETESAAKLDGVMEKLTVALGADSDTENTVTATRTEMGRWQVEGMDGDTVDFVLDADNPARLVTELFTDGEPVVGSKQVFDIDKFSLEDAVSRVVDDIGYGHAPAIMEAYAEIAANAGPEKGPARVSPRDYAAGLQDDGLGRTLTLSQMGAPREMHEAIIQEHLSVMTESYAGARSALVATEKTGGLDVKVASVTPDGHVLVEMTGPGSSKAVEDLLGYGQVKGAQMKDGRRVTALPMHWAKEPGSVREVAGQVVERLSEKLNLAVHFDQGKFPIKQAGVEQVKAPQKDRGR